MNRSGLHAAQLKQKLAEVPLDCPDQVRIRIHRAISWLARAELETDDLDARFMFLWVAFNAVYARETGFEDSAREQLKAFFAQLIALDEDRRLAALMLERFSGPIRTLIANQFVFEPFWKALREHDPSDRWKTQFATTGKLATRAVVDGNAGQVLTVVFDRLYVLRNQLMHGGATWNSRVNRAQVRDGAGILLAVAPVVIDLVLEHSSDDFGEIAYPVLPG